jgi:hypothetical protein
MRVLGGNIERGPGVVNFFKSTAILRFNLGAIPLIRLKRATMTPRESSLRFVIPGALK